MTAASPSSITQLKQTCLHSLHMANGARMAPFAGYEMPIMYDLGVLKEHQHTRAHAGLFDVSHMGQIILRPKSGDVRDLSLALEALVPVDLLGLMPGRQRYAMLTNACGGILDDLMIAHRGDHLLAVVNASRKVLDTQLLTLALTDVATVELQNDLALIALQGPEAQAALSHLSAGVDQMAFMDIRSVDILGTSCVVARSGYTGEDGFEISLPAQSAERFVETLLHNPSVSFAGLGARDTLRLEAGLCLYGSEIDETTTPVEARLQWAIQKVRLQGGARAGGFPGAKTIFQELERGPRRMRVGLRVLSRIPVRSGAAIHMDETGDAVVGAVTSGAFSPTTDQPIAMGYVDVKALTATTLFAAVRDKMLEMQIVKLPFVPHSYLR